MKDDDSITTGERIPLLIADHRIGVLVTATVLIALVFASLGLVLYHATGTAQLDLSRPDLEGVGGTVGRNQSTYVEYSASGPINLDSLQEFDELYKEQRANANLVDAFGGDPLAPGALGIDDPATYTETE